MSKRLDLYRSAGVCPNCLVKIEAADRMATLVRAPAAAAASRSTRLMKRLARTRRRERAARTRAINQAVRLATLPQDGRTHDG